MSNGKGSKRRRENIKKFERNYNKVDWVMKKTGEQWCESFGLKLVYFSGWELYKVDWYKKISEREFVTLFLASEFRDNKGSQMLLKNRLTER